MIQIVHLFNNGDSDGSRFSESNVTVAFLHLARSSTLKFVLWQHSSLLNLMATSEM